MPSIRQAEIVAYTSEQMFRLVDAIEDYSEFIPWCQESRVLLRDPDEVQATLVFSGAGFHKSFTTCNRLQKYKMIEIRLLHGPFRHLEGFWQFEALDDNKSKVILSLEYEFSNRLMGMTFGPFFNQIASTLVEAFCKRAEEVYSK